jgi:glycosyltransferase involved in cell wall biosynthesis
MNPATDKPAILLVGNFLSRTLGTRLVCEDLAEKFAGAGGFRVLTTSDKPGRFARLGDMLATVWRRRREYQVAQVDVYSGPAFLWAEAVCVALRACGKPYALTLHGGNLPDFARRWPRRVRRLLRAAAVVTTPSHYLRQEMQPYRADLRLLPNPLDLSAYEFRPRYNPQPRLMWLRAIHSLYNPVMAVRTLSLLAREFPEARLVLVGPDKGDGAREAVRRAAAELSVADRIELPGSVPKSEVPRRLQHGDVFLNTTFVDNTPTSVIEAMACGLCVVSTNVGGLPYLLRHEHDALLVPPDDAPAMAAAVRRVLTEPGLAFRLSRNGREKALPCDWQSVLPQWQQVFREIMASPARPQPGRAAAALPAKSSTAS